MRTGGRRARREYGFTLIEMMVVVAIVGVLAAVALPMLMKYQLTSKSAEAKTNLAAIRVVEDAYFSEFGNYVSAAPEPATIPGSQTAVFDAPNSGFGALGFHTEGRVYFSYGVTVSADLAGYTADAGADIDADGIVQFWGFAKPDGSGVVAASQVGCNVAALVPLQVGPCDPAHGRSVF